ncbi:FMN-dependent NADH-azoreductase [Gilvimarinus sp. DA14]|uniref:FMN-dependent NADH-azoreductase n=1 Tax=Gilvimarinus sp. DA14 TaxID=2956798 RepID=UPI0020B7DB7C|nr:NAD(P)H-dependent oxidoreductase [Gilvimarinus sp. DA14]UTF59263.1 NAD(P)H-dependent oxidoreductase [Gilvimarinus sp. DA14]
MTKLLIINSSGRINRSITRQLTAEFRRQWQAAAPATEVIERDLIAEPPAFVNEPWVAAAFADPEQHTPQMQQAIAPSDQLVDELMSADHVVIGAPLYNFGMPAVLKAYFDQVVRVGRTFAFDASQPNPYTPLLPQTPVTVITSAGDGALLPGGELYSLNTLEPAIKTIAGFIGLAEPEFIRVGYEEYQDNRHLDSKARAFEDLTQRIEGLTEATVYAEGAKGRAPVAMA